MTTLTMAVTVRRTIHCMLLLLLMLFIFSQSHVCDAASNSQSIAYSASRKCFLPI